jgi:hypothetical protein
MASGFHDQGLETIVLGKILERQDTCGIQIPFHLIHDPGKPVLVDPEDSERIHLDMHGGKPRIRIDIYDMAQHLKSRYFGFMRIVAIDCPEKTSLHAQLTRGRIRRTNGTLQEAMHRKTPGRKGIYLVFSADG